MAKKPAATTVNVALLQSIANSTETDGTNTFGRVTQEEYLAHKDFIVVDSNNVVDGKAAAMLTDAGKQYLSNLSSGTNKDKPMFAVINTGFVAPPSKRGNLKGTGAPTIYPFETLDVGAFFFVGNSQKADAFNKLGSTVSQQNMKYRTPTGEKETVERTKRGPKNKAVLDDQGNKVKEMVTVDKYTQDRHFIIRPVQGGVKYGEWTAPEDGAVIQRDA